MRLDPWAIRSAVYDWFEASDFRRRRSKAALFKLARGRTLLVAAGTGLDFKYLAGDSLVAIDFSLSMLARARRRQAAAGTNVQLVAADAHELPLASGSFDTIISSCTLCSVRWPDRALGEMRRVLVPSGRLLLFEHVRSQHPVLGLTLDLMTAWTRRGGTEMNRDTLSALVRSGFTVDHVTSVYLDIILAIEAVRSPRVASSPS